MTVPQVGHFPLMAFRPFFMVSSTPSEMGFLALHLTQYPSDIKKVKALTSCEGQFRRLSGLPVTVNSNRDVFQSGRSLHSWSGRQRQLDWGPRNTTPFFGWQRGAVNGLRRAFTGLPSGGIHVTRDFQALQLGFVKCAGTLNGVQIGLVNVAHNHPRCDEFPDKLAPGFPIASWSY
jgi:hypothetical protein